MTVSLTSRRNATATREMIDKESVSLEAIEINPRNVALGHIPLMMKEMMVMTQKRRDGVEEKRKRGKRRSVDVKKGKMMIKSVGKSAKSEKNVTATNMMKTGMIATKSAIDAAILEAPAALVGN